jgi:hypothetical protein
MPPFKDSVVPFGNAKVRLFPHSQDPFRLTGILTLKDPVCSEVNATVRSMATPFLALPTYGVVALACGRGMGSEIPKPLPRREGP